MNQNRGLILKETVTKFSKNTGITLTEIARNVGYDQSMMYRHFEKSDLALHIIKKYANIIQYNFDKEIPEMSTLQSSSEPNNNLDLRSMDNANKEVEYWRSKYIDLLEKHTSLLERLSNKIKSRALK